MPGAGITGKTAELDSSVSKTLANPTNAQQPDKTPPQSGGQLHRTGAGAVPH
jgi:hypothetical protein